MFKLSVVIPSYNAAQYLHKSLPSIISQDYDSFEVIVVENGLTKENSTLHRKFDNITFLQSPIKQNKNYACNFAVKKAKYELLLFLDADIVLPDENYLSRLVNFYSILNKNCKLGVLGVTSVNSDENFVTNYFYGLGYYFEEMKDPIHISELNQFNGIRTAYASAGSFMCSKSFWKEVGGFDEFLTFGGDDTDLGIKSYLYGYENRIYASTPVIHIGMQERNDNFKYRIKWGKLFHAHMYTIVKNYSNRNVMQTVFGYFIFSSLKTIKQSFKRNDYKICIFFIYSIFRFIRNLPRALRERRRIQNNRVINKDVFLDIECEK